MTGVGRRGEGLKFAPTEDRISLIRELHIDDECMTELTFRNNRSGKEVSIKVNANEENYRNNAKMRCWRDLWSEPLENTDE